MIIKKTIIILYNIKDKFLADAFKANVLMNNPNYYVVSVDNNNFLYSGTYKTKKFMRNFSEVNIPGLYTFFENVKSVRTSKKIRKERSKLKNPEKVKVKPYSKIINDHLAHMYNIFNRYNTEMVICMSSIALRMALTARKILNSKAVVAAYMPEIVFDKEFVEFECDRFFVVNEQCRKSLIKYGISEEKISITGMPPYRYNREENLELKKKSGVAETLPVVYLTGGRLGYRMIYEFFIELIKDSDKFTLIVNTGKDVKAKKFNKAIALFNAKNILLINEQNEENYIDIADLVITRPRINEIYQCFLKGIPSILIRPLTNIQRENLRNFVEEEVSVTVSDPANITDEVMKLLEAVKLLEVKKSIDKQLAVILKSNNLLPMPEVKNV